MAEALADNDHEKVSWTVDTLYPLELDIRSCRRTGDQSDWVGDTHMLEKIINASNDYR